MSKRMVVVALLVIVGIGACVAYLRHRTYSHFNGGEITADDSRDTTGTVVAVDPAPAHISNKPSAGRPLSTPARNEVPASNTSTSSDRLPPNLPDQATFSGTGRFQVYRQGNLTWRVDTDSGRTCVLFATDDEWRNPRVYTRACGNS